MISILLPNYNNERALPVFFQRIAAHNDLSDVQLVVVDDGSEDGSLPAIRAMPQLRSFRETEIIAKAHEGIVVALNAGLAACKGDIVIRVDGDAMAETRGWINRLAGALRNDSSIGLIGTPVVFDSGLLHSQGRSVISPLGLYDMGCKTWEPPGRRTFDSNVVRPYVSPRSVLTHRLYEVDTVLGVCTAFWRADAQLLGGFDMRFNPVWIEDDDFGVAIRMLGKARDGRGWDTGDSPRQPSKHP